MVDGICQSSLVQPGHQTVSDPSHSVRTLWSRSEQMQSMQPCQRDIAISLLSKSPCHVFEKALAFCNSADTHTLANELLTDQERFIKLAVHECGMHVVIAVTKLNKEFAARAKSFLLAELDQVKASKYGKRVLDEM